MALSQNTIKQLAEAIAVAVVEALETAGINLDADLPPIPPEMQAKAGSPGPNGGEIEIGRWLSTKEPVEVVVRSLGANNRGELVTLFEFEDQTVESAVSEVLVDSADDPSKFRYEQDNV